MANPETMTDLGGEVGVSPDGDKKTRHRKYTNVKTMNKKDLQSELAKLRKEKDALESQVKGYEEQAPSMDMVALSPEMWGSIPEMVYDGLAVRMGEHWRLDKDEVIAYGKAIEAVAERYLPQYAGEHPQLIILCVTAVTITAMKFKAHIEIKRIQGAKNAEPEPNADNNGAGAER